MSIKRDQGYLFRSGSGEYDSRFLYVVDVIRPDGTVTIQVVRQREEKHPVDNWITLTIENFYRMIDQGLYFYYGEFPALTERFR